MRLAVRGAASTEPAAVERLARRLVHPLCGLDTRVGFLLRARTEPRFAVAGGQLTGVHLLIGEEKAGSYHIGGVGLTRAEALIRALGESVERYGQLISVACGHVPTRLATADAMRADGLAVVDPADLGFFLPEQYARPGFPFQPPDPTAGYGWVPASTVPDGAPVLLPAQLVLVGYRPHRGQGEPWLAPAMTTGTATHRTPAAAARGALLELMQIDTAMGHWYGPGRARRIRYDERVDAVQRIVRRHVPPTNRVTFHHLGGPWRTTHTVACVIRQPAGRRPVAALGLGCDTRLAEAMYRSLLEAVGVLQLAKIGGAQAELAGAETGLLADEGGVFDLDSNVDHYAAGGGADLLAEKFPEEASSTAADLPPDLSGPPEEIVAAVTDELLGAGIRLYHLGLTTPDVAHLGLVTERYWSPDLLSLAMPSAPLRGHPGFARYGGSTHDRPHPYP